MASLIPGYNYDIFISYRQKDNRHDGWVTKFVDNLKGELEAAFKEDVSVYFDENPNDRLQETHDVDKTLEGKLKCLIFIPVLSQTYCDPNSFAWQYEFLAFNKLALADRYGRDIRLRSGNVASRILPIRIHDLEQEDLKLFEKETGSVLRAMDFVFKTSTGVNRPLKVSEDHPQDNLNKTFYADQINKVASAIKEIIQGMRRESAGVVKEKIEPALKSEEEIRKEEAGIIIKPIRGKVFTKRNVSISIIALSIVIIGFLLFTKLLNPGAQPEKSIAVLPFKNLSNDPEQEYFSEGIVEAIMSYLSKADELKVISGTSTKRYKNSELSLKEIARELGVASILEGSVQKTGNNIRITTQLIEAKTDVHLWSGIYDRNLSDIFAIQSDVAQSVARELRATLTPEEKEQFEKSYTQNTEAYNLYLEGRFHIKNRTYTDYIKSIRCFELAVAEDKDYVLAYAGLADAYFLLAWYNQMSKPEAFAKAREYANMALAIDNDCAEAHTVLGGILTYNDWNWEEARKELKLAVKLNPNFISARSYYTELLDILRENTETRRQIDIVLELDPFFNLMRGLSGMFYYHAGRPEQAIDEYLLVMEVDTTSNQYRPIFDCYANMGETQKAIDALEQHLLRGDSLNKKYAGMLKDKSVRYDLTKAFNLLIRMNMERQNPPAMAIASDYAKIGKKEEALNWLEVAFENRSSSIPRINNNPDFEFLRSEPRFQALLKKMGLTDYQIPK